MNDVPQILAAIDRGEPQAAERLLPLVYDDLRRLAAAKLAQEKPGQTLQATALVHEVYLRLVGTAGSALDGDARVGSPVRMGTYNSRNHFFAAAAEAMRRILVDSARRKASRKHGGDLARQPILDSEIAIAAPADEVIAVHEALERFQLADNLAAELVKLHYFGGFSLEEAGDMIGMSRATAYRTWTYAKAWLRAELQAQNEAR